MRRLLLPALLGLAHGVSDGAAGLLLGALSPLMPPAQVGVLVLFYNLLAFGGQPVAGLLADRMRRPRAAALAGLTLMCFALFLFVWEPRAAILFAGLGSAAFHVGGGALALCATREGNQIHAAGPGLFAAPGVIGLALGGGLAATGHVILWPFMAALLALIGVIALRPSPALPYLVRKQDEPVFEGHDFIMLAMLIAIALRSAVWNIFQIVLAGRIEVLVILALAAALGKALGGIMADRVGWRRWTMGALVTAAPLLAFGGQRVEALVIGVALLQSATPSMLAMMAQTSPRYPATAAGLALGLAIAIGGVPFLAGPTLFLGGPPIILILIGSAVVVFWFAIRPGRLRSLASQ